LPRGEIKDRPRIDADKRQDKKLGRLTPAKLNASMSSGLPYGDITEAVIGAAFEVHGALGYGFLEAVYRNAMVVELKRRGLSPAVESRMEVRYKDEVVGSYVADMVVNDSVIVEFKVAEEYRKADEAQLLNELAATGKPVGLLINFGRRKVEFKRLVWNLKD
jgi:GxxExxY protein